MAWVQRFLMGLRVQGSGFRVSERIITMITINLEFSKWPEMFKDATLVVALVDRLTYHSHILKMSKSLFDRRNSQILLSFSRLFQVGKLS